jgi:hypothetical protein
MECLICDFSLEYYFSKRFDYLGFDLINYYKCPSCGLVVAKELLKMVISDWEDLNKRFHSEFLNTDFNKYDEDWTARLERQATIIEELCDLGLLNKYGNRIDYACGDGKLVKSLVGKRLRIQGYDKYIDPYKWNYNLCVDTKYDLVICNTFFEHVRNREYLDTVNNLVSDNGVLALSTLVCENVPANPDWSYLLPVHSVIYTNKAMQFLFDQWGYECSVYYPDLLMWFWFKKDLGDDFLDLPRVSGEILYKKGFADYWKGEVT